MNEIRIKDATVGDYFVILYNYFRSDYLYPPHQIIKFNCPWPRYFVKSQGIDQIANIWWTYCDSTTYGQFIKEGIRNSQQLAEQLRQTFSGGISGCIYRFRPIIRTVDDIYENPSVQTFIVPAEDEFIQWYETTKEIEMSTRVDGVRLDPFIYKKSETPTTESEVLDDSNYVIRPEIIGSSSFIADLAKWTKVGE